MAGASPPSRRAQRYTSYSTAAGVRTSSGGARYGANAAASGPSATYSRQPEESTPLVMALEAIGLVAVPARVGPLQQPPELPDRALRHDVDETVAGDEAHDLPRLQIQAFADLLGDDDDNGMTDSLSMSSELPPLAPRQLDGDPERPGLRYPRTQVVTSSGVSYCGSSAAGKTRPATRRKNVSSPGLPPSLPTTSSSRIQPSFTRRPASCSSVVVKISSKSSGV